MNIGFTGAREGGADAQIVTVRQLMADLQPDEFHHGCCVGADEQVGVIMYDSYPFMRIVGHPSDMPHLFTSNLAIARCHEVRPRKPFLARNHDIVNDTDRLIAVVNGPERVKSGTWATVRYARKRKKPIYLVWPNGSVTYENSPPV